jgi:hypothetical protein
MAAVSSLPELTERKCTIDKHTNLATALLGAIQVPRSFSSAVIARSDRITLPS